MDIAVYLIAAAILIVLIVFALKVRGSTQEADEEQQRDVVRPAGPRQRAPEERGAGMPRRRRNLAASMANRRPQREDMELEEREERKKMQDLREQERRQEDEKERQMENKQSRNLLQEFIQHIESSKVVLLEDLASHFGMRTQDAICRLQDLLAQGSLTGVIDDRGKFISITPDELDSVAQFMKKRGRVSITELAQASNSLINLTPESRSSA
ncbi:DDRGK domain containing protein 1 [Dissostichus eleginoides]|uniref:DDRGK domain-containing protein 1 n=1 Tax=Dissostichus eleginoides TaxID=100907 RepID=A0AAD9B570_DISEL|nr:DDRGK domain containing protein 1 [Dissostichus eleginoides]